MLSRTNIRATAWRTYRPSTKKINDITRSRFNSIATTQAYYQHFHLLYDGGSAERDEAESSEQRGFNTV